MQKIIPISKLLPALRFHRGQGYVYGAVNQTCTIALLQAKQRQYGAKMGEGYYQKGGDYKKGLCARWLNKFVTDCVGLVKGTSRDLGGIYRDVSADGIYRLCSKMGTVADMPRIPGVLLFVNDASNPSHPVMGHVGVYLGNNQVIQSAGVLSGIIEGPMSHGWTHWGILSDWFVYDLPADQANPPQPAPTTDPKPDGHAGQADDPAFNPQHVPWLNLGDHGAAVVYLQDLLASKGYSLPKSKLSTGKYDGMFGKETDDVVRKFQGDHMLQVDGIAGPNTWSALLGVQCH